MHENMAFEVSIDVRPTSWDEAAIDHTTPLPVETNNYWNQDEHVVVFSTCIGLVAVFGMMVCMWTVIAELVRCTSEKNKMRYVSLLLKSCINRHCGSAAHTDSLNARCKSNGCKLCERQRELGTGCRSSEHGNIFCCTNNIKKAFKASKVFVLTEVTMSEADDSCESSDMMSAYHNDDMDALDPFPDTRLSEVVAKMLDIDSDGSDVVDEDDERVTAFIDYNEEPRNKGLYREPLKPIEEEDDTISQTESIGKTTPIDVDKLGKQADFDTLPIRPVVKARSVETVFDVYPTTTTTTTTECTLVAKDVKSTPGTECRNSRFRWSVTSV